MVRYEIPFYSPFVTVEIVQSFSAFQLVLANPILTDSIVFLTWWDWGLNLGLFTCNAGTLQLEPHLQSILLWLFWRWCLANCLPSLASNFDPPHISLPSS
jgi:hypothetical protein